MLLLLLTSVCTFTAITNNANLTILFYSGEEQKTRSNNEHSANNMEKNENKKRNNIETRFHENKNKFDA